MRKKRNPDPASFLRAAGAAALFALLIVPVHSQEASAERQAQRTIRLKIAIDEEFRRLPAPTLLEVKRTIAASSRFFEKHFGIPLEMHEIVRWHSDNTKWTLEELFDDLFTTVDRDQNDIVIGFSGQIRSESKAFGVASYDQGYILVKRSLNSFVSKTVLTHELCHVFGAVNLEMEKSVMNESRPEFECDDFTRQVVDLHRNRSFGGGAFPLSPEDRESAILLYEGRKSLKRHEAGLSLRLAALYLEMRDSEKAIRECLEAEKIAPGDPAIRILLDMAYDQKAKVGAGRSSSTSW